MLPQVQIKLEPDEDRSKTPKEKKKGKRSLASPKCTCTSNSESEERRPISKEKSPPNSSKHRQILVNFGMRRRKIFNLKSKKDNLHQIFSSFVSGEPAFSKLLDNAYVVLQEYNPKFGTYVDIDDSKNLRDGSILKAVFFPTGLERDDENPGCIKTKERKSIQNSSKECIQIDSSGDDEEVESSISNSDEMSNPQVQLAPKQYSEKSKVRKSSDEDDPEVQLPPKHNSKKKSKVRKSCNEDNHEVQLPPKHNSEKKSKVRKSCDEENPEVQFPPKHNSEKKSKVRKSCNEDNPEVQLPPKEYSEKSKRKRCYDKDTSEVQLPPKQCSEKKSKREEKKHCLEEQQNIPQECPEEVGDPLKDIKIEKNSEEELPVAKSTCEVPNNQQSPKQHFLPSTPLITEGTNVGSLPGSTTRDPIHFSNGSHLDSAVSQNCNQTRSGHLRCQWEKKASQTDCSDDLADPITRLSKFCEREMINPPRYEIARLSPSRYTVWVDGFLFTGSGSILQIAKQNAASMALCHLLGKNSSKERNKLNGWSKERRTGNREELSVYDKGGRVQSDNVKDKRWGGEIRREERRGWDNRRGRGYWCKGRSWRGGRWDMSGTER